MERNGSTHAARTPGAFAARPSAEPASADVLRHLRALGTLGMLADLSGVLAEMLGDGGLPDGWSRDDVADACRAVSDWHARLLASSGESLHDDHAREAARR